MTEEPEKLGGGGGPPVVKPPEMTPLSVRELGPLEKLAFRLAVVLLALIAVTLFATIFDWMWHAPRAPDLCGASTDQLQAMIRSYKELNDLAMERAARMFEMIVIKALLPVLATVIAFLLGTRTRS